MSNERIGLGKAGEAQALYFLIASGYKILEKNYRNKLGEIDIIARDGDTLCFIEVKTRTASTQGTALEAVTFFKKRKMVKVALWYLKTRKLVDQKARFDVIGVDLAAQSPLRIVKNAFDLSDAGF